MARQDGRSYIHVKSIGQDPQTPPSVWAVSLCLGCSARGLGLVQLKLQAGAQIPEIRGQLATGAPECSPDIQPRPGHQGAGGTTPSISNNLN